MGYTTDFEGVFKLDKPLKAEHKAYLEAFAYIRHMKRDIEKLWDLPDPIRIAAGIVGTGIEGEFYVGSASDGNYGQGRGWDKREPSVLQFNYEPSTQPGLWCQWVPTSDGTGMEWNGAEKFYSYVEWLEYLVANFLGPWGYVLNGTVSYQGEQADDVGHIQCVNNVVSRVESNPPVSPSEASEIKKPVSSNEQTVSLLTNILEEIKGLRQDLENRSFYDEDRRR